MPEPRAWVVVSDEREPEEVPPYLADADPIRWPEHTLPLKEPGQPVQYFSPDELYYRHPLIEGEVYMFVPSGRDPNAVPERVRRGILLRAGKLRE